MSTRWQPRRHWESPLGRALCRNDARGQTVNPSLLTVVPNLVTCRTCKKRLEVTR